MSDAVKNAPDSGLSAAVRWVAGSAVVLAVGAALASSVEAAIGVGLGGALATVNLLLFVRLGKAFLAQGGRGSPWLALGLIKLLGLFFAMYVLLRHTHVSALALLVGYGALPIGIVLAGVLGPRPPDDADLSAPSGSGAGAPGPRSEPTSKTDSSPEDAPSSGPG